MKIKCILQIKQMAYKIKPTPPHLELNTPTLPGFAHEVCSEAWDHTHDLAEMVPSSRCSETARTCLESDQGGAYSLTCQATTGPWVTRSC